jgi:hypothetical protein
MSIPYIYRGGEQSFPPPYRASDVHLYGFWLDSTRTALQDLCDKYLNKPSQGQVDYRPVLPRVLLAFADIRQFDIGSSIQREFSTSEIDVAFWVPVVAMKRVAGIDVPDHFAWFMPDVFVNNPWAMVSGREVLGFPKEMAAIAMPDDPKAAQSFTVDALSVPVFGPNASCQSRRLLEVRRTAAPADLSLKQTWQELSEAMRELARAAGDGAEWFSLPGIGLLFDFLKIAIFDAYQTVFLKQFRAAESVTDACYLAIVEAPTKISGFRGGGLLPGTYELTVQTFASHPIVAELGLAAATIPSVLSLYLQFDFEMDAGKVMWQA